MRLHIYAVVHMHKQERKDLDAIVNKGHIPKHDCKQKHFCLFSDVHNQTGNVIHEGHLVVSGLTHRNISLSLERCRKVLNKR